jgi:hypothetical protein
MPNLHLRFAASALFSCSLIASSSCGGSNNDLQGGAGTAPTTGGSVSNGGSTGTGGSAGGSLATTGGLSGTGGAATGGNFGSGGAVGVSGGASTGGSAGTAAGSGGTKNGGTGGTGGGNVAGSGGANGGTGGASAGAAGSSGATDGCTPGPLEKSGELLGRYGTLKASAGGKEYFMQVNEWNSTGAQTMAYGGDFFFKMTKQEGSAATNGGPTGFPSVFIGANSRHSTAGSNLPKQVSALTTVPTTWSWKDNGTLADTAANIYNATYDVWFSTNAAGEPNASGPSGGYLMVWLHDPPAAEPIGGEVKYPGVTIPGVSGTWDVWVGPNGTRPCISYVRTETTESMAFDLNAFIKDAVTNRPNTIQANWYLSNVFIGFEIWKGGVGLETTNFCAVVN